MHNQPVAPSVDAVIFDIGGVLVRIDLSAALTRSDARGPGRHAGDVEACQRSNPIGL